MAGLAARDETLRVGAGHQEEQAHVSDDEPEVVAAKARHEILPLYWIHLPVGTPESMVWLFLLGSPEVTLMSDGTHSTSNIFRNT